MLRGSRVSRGLSHRWIRVGKCRQMAREAIMGARTVLLCERGGHKGRPGPIHSRGLGQISGLVPEKKLKQGGSWACAYIRRLTPMGQLWIIDKEKCTQTKRPAPRGAIEGVSSTMFRGGATGSPCLEVGWRSGKGKKEGGNGDGKQPQALSRCKKAGEGAAGSRSLGDGGGGQLALAFAPGLTTNAGQSRTAPGKNQGTTPGCEP